MHHKPWLRPTLGSVLLAIALIALSSFVAAPTRAAAAPSHSPQLSLLVKTAAGPQLIPVDGKPHLVSQHQHACVQSSTGCISQQMIMARFISVPATRGIHALVSPLSSFSGCPRYLDTWNYTDDYSSWFGIHYWHMELDTQEYIDPCNGSLTHIFNNPWCSGYNGAWCDGSGSNGSYWNAGWGEQFDWYSQNTCFNSGFGTSCSTERLQSDIQPDGGMICHDSVGSDPSNCGD